MVRKDEVHLTALHEAAHAVIQYRAAGDFVGSASIVSKDGNLGTVTDSQTDSCTAEDLEARILSCFAGGAADRRNGCFNEYQVSDDEEAAAQCLKYLGIHDDSEVERFRFKAAEMVDQYWPEIEAVAGELLKYQTLDDTEVVSIIEIQSGTDETVAAGLALYRAAFLNRL